MRVYRILIIATAFALVAACSRATEPGPAAAPASANHPIVRMDPDLDAVIASDANVEKIASASSSLKDLRGGRPALTGSVTWSAFSPGLQDVRLR